MIVWKEREVSIFKQRAAKLYPLNINFFKVRTEIYIERNPVTFFCGKLEMHYATYTQDGKYVYTVLNYKSDFIAN